MDANDIRTLIPDHQPKGVKCCTICGKPESKNTDKVNAACPAHAAAVNEDLPGQFRRLVHILGVTAKDYCERDKWNAQLESIRAKLYAARQEHDAYSPAEKVSDKQAVMRVLLSALGLVGISITAEQAEALEHSPLSLAQSLHSELESINAALGGMGLRTK